MLAFFVPSLVAGTRSRPSTPPSFFNPSDPANPTSTLVVGSASANYEMFSLRKFAELGRSRAELASAEAGELEQRFQAALETESSYYDVLVNQELARVARERAPARGEGLGVARARVASGAAVQTDSLQLVLELTRAQVDVLLPATTRFAPRSSSSAAGSASRGPVDAVPLDTMPAPDLPITLPEAVRAALEQGPQFRTARANERAAEAALKSQRSDYFPTLGVGALHQRYDTEIFPSAANVTSVTFSLSFPHLEQRAAGDRGEPGPGVARRGARHPRGSRARGAAGRHRRLRHLRDQPGGRTLAGVGVAVARENYRMQEMRYRAGASTILDLLDSQVSLAEAEAGLVQARYVTRLSLARLEAILGRRLFSNKDAP